MFLTSHATAAVLIAEQIHSPTLAFALGWLSHYLLDMIPHGDDKLLDHLPRRAYLVAFTKIAAVDFFIMIGWLWFLFNRGTIVLTPVMIAAVVGSLLPDILNGVYLVTRSRLIEWNHRVNDWAHTAIIKKPLPPVQGFFIQAIFFLLLAVYLVG
ncbi:MAG: hypothetical protein A2951_01885 [Candidatus Buchananbacteria bacterium RIFCSPLOWO2_01_FULL_56_15]|uniref:Uncharacterized protein n=1 Tax=Candidatus Buchananbacteria bacterium RIFCSPLOWO2_01_FULL_56_15 TaxID=1797547 RepID=A0A1G1YUA4_9BACT|nr:MAG: hypothetical protein A2951_01885 [Candidatus Buchananbacteria bacterium RIFCSPLOWO2_01_FULL_56_15]